MAVVTLADDLARFNSGTRLANYAYHIGMTAPEFQPKPRPITDRKCPDCGDLLPKHRQKCDACTTEALRRRKRESMRRRRAARKDLP